WKKEVTMQGDDERAARREFDKEKDEEESSESSKEHLNATNATLKLNKDANVPETSKSNASSSVSKPEPKAKLNVRLLRKNQQALIDKMEKMKKSKELEKLDPMKMAWSVEPDEISDSEGLKGCVIAGRNHDDSGAVNVTVHVTRQLKKTVRAVMDTGADISLISREWLRDKARIWREDLFLEKQQEEYPVKPVKPPLIFKTVSGASETAHEAILMKTVVMTCGKRAKFTPHCCLIKYYLVDVLPVDLPLLIGRHDLANLGVKLNVRSLDTKVDHDERLRSAMLRYCAIIDSMITV
ncbi:hypothetical protein ADUPG1_001355, partial [Aduncisulcus paluster]